MTAISADPAVLQASFEGAATDLAWVTALLELLGEYSEFSESIVCQLLQMDGVDAVDEPLIVAVAAWGETVHRLFDQLSTLLNRSESAAAS